MPPCASAPTQFEQCELEKLGNLPLSRVANSAETQLPGQWESASRQSKGVAFTIRPPRACWYVNACYGYISMWTKKKIEDLEPASAPFPKLALLRAEQQWVVPGGQRVLLSTKTSP